MSQTFSRQLADPGRRLQSAAAVETCASCESPLAGPSQYSRESDATTQVNDILAEIVKEVSSGLAGKPAAILLTGSFARNEGSVLRIEHGLRMLSDVEFLVVCPPGLAVEGMQRAVDEKAREISKQLGAKAVECAVEFSAVKHNYFRNLRPAIFSYELMAHARTMWGDEGILASARRFPASEIPKWDAWRLLNNRLLEQLQWADIGPRWGLAELQAAFYHVLKCYLDMATAILIFTGRYRSRYSERADTLNAWAQSASGKNAPFADELARRVSSCTAFKLNADFRMHPLGVDLTQEPERFRADVRRAIFELVDIFHQVWCWAGSTIVGLNAKSLKDDAMLQDAMLRSQSLAEKLRGWAKLALMREVRMQPDFLERMSRLLFKGSPRYLTYTVASDLYFLLPQVMDGKAPEVVSKEDLLPVTFRQDGQDLGRWWRARANVFSGWKLFLRNHWA